MKPLPTCRILLAAFLCLLSVPAFSASSREEADRTLVEMEGVELFGLKKWKDLDALTVKYRTGLPATAGGAQKLTLLYAGLRGTFNDGDPEAEKLADAWIKASPQSPGGYIMKSMMIEARASELRGDGPIDSVDPAIWPEYKKLLKQSVKVMLDNKKIAQTDPEWYSQMIMLAKLQGDATARQQWFKEGSDRFPTFQGIYMEAMVGALPKWGGSPEEVEQIARQAAEKSRDKSGMTMYTYVWYNAFSNQPELMPLLAQKKIVNWDDMRQGWSDRLKNYPDHWTVNGILTCACLAGDKKTFSEADAKLERDVIKRLWLPGLSYESCKKQLR